MDNLNNVENSPDNKVEGDYDDPAYNELLPEDKEDSEEEYDYGEDEDPDYGDKLPQEPTARLK